MKLENVLIAEDSPTQAMRLQFILEKHGFRVTAGVHGRAALDHLANLRPALVITDIQMPVMDGFELCREIKQNAATRDIPVILLTSLSAPQDIIQGLACGADNFIVKPYEEAFLMARIKSVLANIHLNEGDGASGGIAVEFAGERHVIESSRRQILNLLLSTYETAVNTNLELLQAHEQLKSMQAQLIEAEKLQATGRLAAGVAHEVRNPLAILEMGLQCLAAAASDSEEDPIIAEMRGAVERANVVVTSLMDIASPSSLGMGESDLGGVIDGAVEVLRGELERVGVKVVRNLEPDLPPLRLDADRIGQAFINIISNACQAMPSGGTLTIAARQQTVSAAETAFDAGDRSGTRFREGERVVMVEISDTGPGIAAENLDKVFEPFFSTRPTGQGMGLGLTVARKLTELHRGSIRIQNRSEGGAMVTLTFKIP